MNCIELSVLGDYNMTIFSRFMNDESGATAIEYGLIAALVGVALIGALSTMEAGLSSLFTSIGGTLSGAGAGGP
jgi:pilus assembly protein Flp/PilA